ncbi:MULTISPECIES: cytochrome c oxidase assembly factor CtaG [Brevibacillus]|uniref:Cytochrome c oxidase assembly factor CtaG n=1 Tax=Brevibacillus invocatus TaxID=173959 RepID=A0A3M8CME5_9BACL|nr:MULTISPECIES: cytochrome c oxidase assembly factor CtaG [Brevibacillus]MCM3081729.1 cytochrome c oxidase assembly factor CtaG [Brevibacillus invocatus]MCM3432137.1 cytochrome c oxidase assembly factor CtaG [Brevibacillus invocatus]MDH4615590.1 cytochrome c oxidase assembly factor CtaG [Brevibacillus sp. AY1]RNB76900.1 cytochrome c oxidase assembly factor CtaG [Brevibacillus invocatus]
MNLTYLTETFGFRGTWNPELIVLTVLIGVAYYSFIGPLRHTFPDAEPVSLRQKIMFSAGLLLFYFSLGSPLNVSGHFLFSAHMLQQSLLYLVMPLLILAGTPKYLFRYLASYGWIRMILKIFTHPLPAVILFNALFSFYHVPFILDLAMNNLAMHNLIHLILLIAAFFMWMPVIAPVPEIHRLTHLQKLAYIFANGVLITPACALIMFAGAPMYDTYLNGPTMLCAPFFSAPIDKSMFTITMDPLEDQRLGGILMKLMQELNYGIVLAYVFTTWYRKERDQPDEGLLPH